MRPAELTGEDLGCFGGGATEMTGGGASAGWLGEACSSGGSGRASTTKSGAGTGLGACGVNPGTGLTSTEAAVLEARGAGFGAPARGGRRTKAVGDC